MADSRRERGKRKLREVALVPDFEPPDAFTAVTVDTVFGELWYRPGLSTRERRLLSLAVVGSRGLDFEVRTHIAGALASGDVSVSEMVEAILHITHYAGWPCGAILHRNLLEVCREQGLEVPGPDPPAEE